MAVEPLRGPSYTVVLDPEELDRAYAVGALRNDEARRRGLKDKHGLDPLDGLRVHQVGAAGEAAFAKFAGVEWDASVNTFKGKADVAGFEIRTRTQDNYDLIIRQDDNDSRPYVLVYNDPSTPDTFVVKGYKKAGEAKKNPRWKKSHGNREPAWFVPWYALDDFIFEE